MAGNAQIAASSPAAVTSSSEDTATSLNDSGLVLTSARAAEDERSELPLGPRGIDDGQRQHRSADRADQRVHRVPNAIDNRDLVGPGLRKRCYTGDADHPPAGEHLQAF
jgi:hypothetical protein